jgi:hypothetical protein
MSAIQAATDEDRIRLNEGGQSKKYARLELIWVAVDAVNRTAAAGSG